VLAHALRPDCVCFAWRAATASGTHLRSASAAPRAATAAAAATSWCAQMRRCAAWQT
jgi:hypothetical protein